MAKKLLFIFLLGIILVQTISAESSQNDTNITTEIESITLNNIIPSEFAPGDVQLTLSIKNNGTKTLNNLLAFISGEGFSTYNIIPIDSLEPGITGYIFVEGNFKNPSVSKNILLTIRINNYLFYKNVSVSSDTPTSTDNTQKEEAKRVALAEMTKQWQALKGNYTILEQNLATKKDENYDVSGINLNDLKNYLRNAQSSILSENVESANVNINLALEEYTDLKYKLDNTTKKSIITRLKDNALIFSAIAGSFLTIFALSELLTRKSERIVHKISRKNPEKLEPDSSKIQKKR